MHKSFLRRLVFYMLLLATPYLLLDCVGSGSSSTDYDSRSWYDGKPGPGKTKNAVLSNFGNDPVGWAGCSWKCHDRAVTKCIAGHGVRLFTLPLLPFTPFYMFIIVLLNVGGSYAFSNFIFLVTLWPAFIWFLIIIRNELSITLAKVQASTQQQLPLHKAYWVRLMVKGALFIVFAGGFYLFFYMIQAFSASGQVATTVNFFSFINYIYVLCMDFEFQLIGMTGLSYFQINTLIFCILMPGFTLYFGWKVYNLVRLGMGKEVSTLSGKGKIRRIRERAAAFIMPPKL